MAENEKTGGWQLAVGVLLGTCGTCILLLLVGGYLSTDSPAPRNIFYHYQALIAGLLALAGGALAYAGMRQQIAQAEHHFEQRLDEQDTQERNRILRKIRRALNASRRMQSLLDVVGENCEPDDFAGPPSSWPLVTEQVAIGIRAHVDDLKAANSDPELQSIPNNDWIDFVLLYGNVMDENVVSDILEATGESSPKHLLTRAHARFTLAEKAIHEGRNHESVIIEYFVKPAGSAETHQEIVE